MLRRLMAQPRNSVYKAALKTPQAAHPKDPHHERHHHLRNPEMVSAEEWQLRADLAACYRLVALYGWSDLIFTHISARIPGPEHHFLINPYGLMFDEIPPAAWSRWTCSATNSSSRPTR